MRFGLCCLFKHEQISFRTTTAKSLLNLSRKEQLHKLSSICHDNAKNLLLALQACQKFKIGAFRILSPFFPRMTHPLVGYKLSDLPQDKVIRDILELSRAFSQTHDIRLSFHPDQFVVLSSPHTAVVENSIRELDYHGYLAELVGADVINIHGGGVYGNKEEALARFSQVFAKLPERVKSRLTLENDDQSYAVRDLLPICTELSIPLVYDVHHHRCNPDGLSVEEATEISSKTWQKTNREQYCHISSPRSGWGAGSPKPHADYINPGDFPECWLGRNMTVDIEAKAKELAVIKLMSEI
jgi:UV DNA damage endonuclease